MLTFLSFLLTVAGCVNWLLIGLLQYDFIAGFFGFQAAIMSRIFYVLFGLGAVYLILRVIINKGTFKIWERKKKKGKEEKATEKATAKESGAEREAAAEMEAFPAEKIQQARPAYANVEAAAEQVGTHATAASSSAPQKVHFENLQEFRINHAVQEQGAQFAQSLHDTPRNTPDNFFSPADADTAQNSLFDEHLSQK